MLQSSTQYEGRSADDPIGSWTDIAKKGVGAWIDAQYYERVGGDTTGSRVRKGGAGGPVLGLDNGQVRTTAQQDGTAVDTNGIAGIPTNTILLFGALGLAAYVLMD